MIAKPMSGTDRVHPAGDDYALRQIKCGFLFVAYSESRCITADASCGFRDTGFRKVSISRRDHTRNVIACEDRRNGVIRESHVTSY